MEVFISYSTKDSTIANAVCAALENSGIGCFIAPRDIHPGLSYASEIIRGINEVKAFLVIISSSSNASEHVANEVEIAFNAKKTIIPFFVENVPMSLELKYYLSRKHWLIAYPYYEQQLPNLVKVISELLGVGDVPAQSLEDNNIKTENGIANAENGKPDGVDDCPPVLRGTSAAEGVNDSPSTDDGETVVGNSANPVILSASEPSVDARRDQSQESYKHANEEILPPSGCQNDNGGEMRDESGEVKDEGGEWRDEREGLGGTSKKKWTIIIAVLVIGAVAALLGTLSGGGSDDTAAQTRGTINGHDYVDLGLSVKWATCNVGASTPRDYGDYYAWGETSTKSSYDIDNSTTFGKQMSNIAGNPTWDAARKNWGSPWRLPTKAEFQELIDNCTWEWSTRNGHNGYKVTSKKNGNSIFLPAAGWSYGTSSSNQESYGIYWSATPDESDADLAASFTSSRVYRYTLWDHRYNGYSVRPVSE